MTSYEDLWQQYVDAQKELQEAEANQRQVEQRHTISSGPAAIPFLQVSHPEVQEAEEGVQKAREAQRELLRRLRECLPGSS